MNLWNYQTWWRAIRVLSTPDPFSWCCSFVPLTPTCKSIGPMSKYSAFDICLVLESTKQPQGRRNRDSWKDYRRGPPPFQIEVSSCGASVCPCRQLQISKQISRAEYFDIGSIDLQVGVKERVAISPIAPCATMSHADPESQWIYMAGKPWALSDFQWLTHWEAMEKTLEVNGAPWNTDGWPWLPCDVKYMVNDKSKWLKIHWFSAALAMGFDWLSHVYSVA